MNAYVAVRFVSSLSLPPPPPPLSLVKFSYCLLLPNGIRIHTYLYCNYTTTAHYYVLLLLLLLLLQGMKTTGT